MEVHIRLQKFGKVASKRSNYRVVAISRKSSRHSRPLEHLGYYNPKDNPASLHIDLEKLEKWIKKGAIMSDTVRSLVKKTKKSA